MKHEDAPGLPPAFSDGENRINGKSSAGFLG